MEDIQPNNVIPLNPSKPLSFIEQPERPLGPIEQKLRAQIDKLKNTSYRDTFDWTIYDQIAQRYGSKQPRGGVVFRTTFKLVNYHTSCNKCHYAFEIDTYGRGCIHDCVYCYAKDQLSKYAYWNNPIPFPVDIAEIRKIMYTVFETDKWNEWREVLEKKIPVRIGSMSDSFMYVDRKYKVTQELLKILKYYRYPYIIFTRSDLVAEDNYLDLLDRDLASVQFSISGDNDYLIKKIEPGAPSVAKRIAALEKLNKAGFWTTVRINPLFPKFPDGYYSDKNDVIQRFGSIDNVPVLDLWTPDFLDKLKQARVPSVLAGFVRLSPAAVKAMSKALDLSLAEFFKPEFLHGTSDRKYSNQEIAVYYMQIKSELAKRGIRFNTCYIGNGEEDYYQYQHLWDNKQDCCDAKGNVKGFVQSSQSVPWSERRRHAPNEEIVQTTLAQEAELKLKYPQAATSSDISMQPEV